MNIGLYARVSTHDQQTLNMQIQSMQKYAKARQWKVVKEVSEIGSGAKERPERDALIKSARRRELDIIVVWKLDRWGRSVTDLLQTLRELNEVGVGFVSITEALDLTTASGRAMAGLLAIFSEFEREILRERVKAGIAHARSQGKPHGRPNFTFKYAVKVRQLFGEGLSKSKISRQLKLSRTSVRRILEQE